MNSADDLTASLSGTRTWLLLKTILTDQIIAMTEGETKTKLLEFLSKHWGCHAPREAEIADMQTRLTRVTRDFERLKSIPESTRMQRKCRKCGKTKTTISVCASCDNK